MKEIGKSTAAFHGKVAAAKDRRRITNRTDMEGLCRKFYMNLFASCFNFPVPQIHTPKQKVPLLTTK